MPHLHKVLTSAMFAVMCLTVAVQAEDEKNPASEASEQTVPENVRGKTSDKGPTKIMIKGSSESEEPKKEEKAEKKEKKKEKKVKKEEVKETSDAGDEEKAVACAVCKSKDCAGCQKCAAKDNETACTSKDCKACAHDDKHVHAGKKSACASCDAKVVDKNAKCPNCGKKMSKCKCPPAVVEASETLNAAEAARKKLEFEQRTTSAIRRLTTSGWREAYASLVEGGKDAVPFLIEAMGDNDKPAYQLGGHVKADAGRAPRQRTQAEVCCEVLTDIVKNRSNFRGEVPTVDQKGWQEWWTSNQAGVTFGN